MFESKKNHCVKSCFEDQDLRLRTSENIHVISFLLFIYCTYIPADLLTQILHILLISNTEAVLLRCYMMYVMLSPYLLHEIGSRNTSLWVQMDTNLIVDGKSQLYTCQLCILVMLSGSDWCIRFICRNFKSCFRNVHFRNVNKMRPIFPAKRGLTKKKKKNRCGHDEITSICFSWNQNCRG